MRLILLLISILILGLLMTFWLKSYVAPAVNQKPQVDKQVERMEQQVDDYKKNIEEQEQQIYDQIKQTR